MTNVCVFLGPTLGVDEARLELNADYCPPVSEGDVYRACRRGARAVGIVDGYFERLPAVWHKEILWAMANGVHVFGSASMGALRAAELDAFGMRGIGWIFEAYRSGELSDDDEVTIAHGSAEFGYRAVSEAMVNIRSTLRAAENANVVSETTHEVLVRIAKQLFYRERSWPLVLRRGAETVPAEELELFRAWLSHGRVDQKAEDARAMLRAMRALLATDPAPLEVRWHLANTLVWNRARQQAAASLPSVSGGSTADTVEAVLDEVRLLGADEYGAALDRSLVRVLAVDAARTEGMEISGERLGDAVHRFRLGRNLERGADLADFLETNEMSLSDLESLVRAEEMAIWTTGRVGRDALQGIIDDLRLRGEYQRNAERARLKRTELEKRGLLDAQPADVGCSEDEILDWYFHNRLGLTPPDRVADYARASGFADELAFRRAVWREYVYSNTHDATDAVEESSTEGRGPLRRSDIVAAPRPVLGKGHRIDGHGWNHPLAALVDPETPGVYARRAPQGPGSQ